MCWRIFPTIFCPKAIWVTLLQVPTSFPSRLLMDLEIIHDQNVDGQVMLTGASRLTSLDIGGTSSHIGGILQAIDRVPSLRRLQFGFENLSWQSQFDLGQLGSKLSLQGGSLVVRETKASD